MRKSLDYINGVIAAKEVYLLGDKISKLCESSAEDAFRAISESGFGKGAEAVSVYEYEKLLYADERDLDEFIREYAPTNAEKAYLLSPRDFHNAKAILKAHFLKTDANKMLAPEGLLSIEEITRSIEEGNYKPLGEELSSACEKAAALFGEDNAENASGAEVGAIFERALYARLKAVCARNPMLKKLTAKKSDLTDILTALRSKTPEYAANNYVLCGKLKACQLENLFLEDGEKAVHALDGTGYEKFLQTCIEDKSVGLPLTRGELIRDNIEIDFLAERKYELKRTQPFLYYVLRRRAENANLRILFVCLLAGMSESEIKKRLRSV
ncbi:MAG: V-type ATPase subunit [Clostridia bacterium]|nr:V-type ATPase subunit [Clostridia bacterium]